jgi:hypothetical protein
MNGSVTTLRGALSEELADFGLVLIISPNGHAESVQVFQNFSQDHLSCGDDVYPVSAFNKECGRSFA